MIYLRDHGKAHVHAVGPGARAKILIENQVVIRSRGFTEKELGLLCRFIKERKHKLLEAWKDAQE